MMTKSRTSIITVAIMGNSVSEINRLLDKMATVEAESELEESLGKSLNEIAQNINCGNAHKGIPVRVKRMSTVPEHPAYAELSDAAKLLYSLMLSRHTLSQKSTEFIDPHGHCYEDAIKALNSSRHTVLNAFKE